MIGGLFLLLLFGSISNPVWVPGRVHAASDGGPPRYALLVGITNYKDPRINKIDGCENNVPLLAETLIGRYGFDRKNILTLIDEQATKASLIDRFRSHLIGNARKAKAAGTEAVVLFYFCGHGSQYPDQDGDENDGLDETFLPYDSRTGDVFDILDDEIDDLKAELRAFTHNTTLILESCHSGTGSRELNEDSTLIVQEAPPDERKRPPYKRIYPPTKDEDELTYTEISASASFRTAKSESKEHCNCEKPYSLMTKALVEALNRATHSTTYQELVREVNSAVSLRSRQDPQVEGNRYAVLFRGAARRARPYIEIEKLLADDDRIVIRAGKIHGLKVGSQVAIYSSGTLVNKGAEGWLANGVVSSVGDVNSIVLLPSPAENENVKRITQTSHVVLASPVFGGGHVLVDLHTAGEKNARNTEAANAVAGELRALGLFENQLIRLADAGSQGAAEEEPKAAVRLRRGRVGDPFIDPKLLSMPSRTLSCDGDKLTSDAGSIERPAPSREVYFLDDGDPGGLPLFGRFFSPDSEDLADDIAQAIHNYVLQLNLKTLDNAASNLAASIDVTIDKNVGIAPVCKEGRLTYEPTVPNLESRVTDGKVPIDSFFRLSVKNISGEVNRERTKNKFASGEPLHVAVILLGNNGDISVVYPRLGANDPLNDGARIERYFQATAPVGTEHFMVVVSRKRVDFSFLDSKLSRRAPLSPLEQILTQSGTRTRDSGTLLPDEPDQWGVVHIELGVVEPAAASAIQK